ncbi:rod shape-determining protein MreC [Psychroflexus planctonicus]|uniref:Cell shape-determining protein MreC n=2 Tax=Psychroflexus planctonicus TaxID=1526575 RepID=A0ABQ1SE29_9FLAO|nr:rod shape-determining protein MreC [Psychroflexus planctonicus]
MFVALFLTVEAHSYHTSKWVSSTNFISASIFEFKSGITDYIGLYSENEKLTLENTRLRNKLLNLEENAIFDQDSLILKDSTFISFPVKLISNSYLKTDNYLLLNKGEKDGMYENMGIISSQGIVGIVEETTANYARVISILNSNISINAKLKKSNHFGSLTWNAKQPNFVELVDVPRSAVIKVGDSVVTGGNSLIFPENLPIGEISDFQLNENQGYYDISIKLFNDMTSLKNLYAIQFNRREEASFLLENKQADE